ncbi:hypothetical protein, partial [Clostridium perfringens]|uniref:hypothetical protein n=1 Tax=Clostridium perfringens TaxID=1502 RepID=UPI003221B8AD
MHSHLCWGRPAASGRATWHEYKVILDLCKLATSNLNGANIMLCQRLKAAIMRLNDDGAVIDHECK